MSESLFEQYKTALRRGHLAALAGELENALAAYDAAAYLVPERALPLASRGTVLHRLDRWPEAAEAFDRALQLAPDDEAALRARATARAERELRSGAAADFERLAFVLDVAGRAEPAAEAARRAAELEPSAARTALADRLGAAAAHLADLLPATPAADGVEGAVEGANGAWPGIDLPSPPPPPIEGPPPDPEALLTEAALVLESGEVEAARDLMLTAARVHRDAGRVDAALDVCLNLLSIAPGEPRVHLAIANLQLDRGWTDVATEKLDLLVRLTSLTGDTQAEADVHGLASERLRDEPAPSAAGR